MDRFGEHIDNKFGGCDIPYNGETKQQDIEQAIRSAIEKITALAEAIRAGLTPAIHKAVMIYADITHRILHLYPNKRVVHLAFHGKYRVRKKNIRRIEKWLKTGGNND